MAFDVRPDAYCWLCGGWIRACDPIYWNGLFPYCSHDCRGDFGYYDAPTPEETSDGPA